MRDLKQCGMRDAGYGVALRDATLRAGCYFFVVKKERACPFPTIRFPMGIRLIHFPTGNDNNPASYAGWHDASAPRSRQLSGPTRGSKFGLSSNNPSV